MQRRSLGTTGIEVSEIGFGTWQLGNAADWSSMDDPTAFRLVSAAVDAGITLFDTAPHYASGRSEEILGKALQGTRRNVVLVSKFGHGTDDARDFSVASFWNSLESSLRRLRTDYLDVCLIHNPGTDLYRGADPIWSALEQARTRGMIRGYGASLDRAVDMEACLANTGSQILEILFNILHQDARRAFPAVRRAGAGTLAKVPLDSGWLTGRFGAGSRFSGVRSRWTPGQIDQRASLVGALSWLTADGTPLSQKALGYILAYEEVGCVIPGMRTPGQLEDNLAASGNPVSPAERRRLETFWNTTTGNGAHLLPW